MSADSKAAEHKDSLSLLSDEELVLRCRSECESKSSHALFMTELVCRYFPYVKSAASRYCGDVSYYDDLVEEGLIGLMNAVRGYSVEKDGKAGSGFSSFAGVCIVNRIKTAAVRLSRHSHGEVSDPDEEGSDTLTPENILLERELIGEVKSKLSPLEYRIFTLYISGCKGKQAAAALNISEKSAENAAERMRKKLRDMLSV